MKNPYYPLQFMDASERLKTDLVPLAGEFDGYYVNRFNDILSYQTSKPKKISTFFQHQDGKEYELVQLYDDDGTRRKISRRKIIIESLGKKEFEARENNRKNKKKILADEDRAVEEYMRKQKEESDRESAIAFRAYQLCYPPNPKDGYRKQLDLELYRTFTELSYNEDIPGRQDKAACEKAQLDWIATREKQIPAEEEAAEAGKKAQEEDNRRWMELYEIVMADRVKRGAKDCFEECIQETHERFDLEEALGEFL